MTKLIEAAAQAGLEVIEGDILASNEPMLGLMRALGFSLASAPDSPEIRRASMRLQSETAA